MAVVRVADRLLKEIRSFIDKDENKYQYPSIAAFVNNAIYEKLNNKKKRR